MASQIRRMRRALVGQQNRDEFGCWIPGKKSPATASSSSPSTHQEVTSSSLHKKGKSAAMEKGKAEKRKSAAMEKGKAEKRKAAAMNHSANCAHMSIWELHEAVAASQLKVKAIEEELAKLMGRKNASAGAQVKMGELKEQLVVEKAIKKELHGALERAAKRARNI
ncbi:unnamed protein product [Urochloa humidicola]